MNYRHRLRQLRAARFWQGNILAALAMLALALPVVSNAQETTSTIRGTVSAPDGSPASGATVVVRDTRTGTTRTVTTNANGGFSVRGVSVGGPYTIRVESSQYQSQFVTDVYADLSSAAEFSIALSAMDATMEEITVTAAMVETAALAVGPGTSFTLEEIESMPSIARQIRDVIRIDPRVNLGRSEGGGGYGINCLGGSPRSNSFTIDGSLANDGFGLNEGTGTSARFAFPIPFDTVASASVEFAPLDVQYSQFTGCNINVVTKPGSNEFHGSAFYLFNDDSLTGDSINNNVVITDPFEDTNYGVNFSGPIIKDKLFFFVAYEETDEGSVQNSGPIGAGFANEDWLTLAEANQIKGILDSQYNRNVGDIVRTLPQTSERTFVRLDWNINDQHRAELTYTKLEELNLDPDDLGFGGFTFGDNFEFEGIEQDTIGLRLYSNWTDRLSTEVRYSKFDVTDIQGPQGGGEAQDAVPIPRIEVEDGSGDVILTSGPGFFRSANDLQYEISQIKLSADYQISDHIVTVGYEQEARDIFNLFIPDATGTITFDTVADLQAGTASSISINDSFTGVASDAAASFERTIDSVYIQDEWQINDAFTLIAGLRYDEYSTNRNPISNPVFQQRYGFSNTQTFDGLDLLQPRIGLTWDLPQNDWGTTQMRVGYGVFGGGDPTVHFANAYQNFGGAIGSGRSSSALCTAADLQVINNGQFTGIPACVRQAGQNSANGNTGDVAAVDPNFKVPSNHRYNFGINHVTELDNEFLNGWEIQFDYIYTEHKDAVDWIDLTLTPNGVILPDGRPQFFAVDPLRAGCNATFNGIGRGFSNAGPDGGPCDAGGDDQDILMTNGVEGSTSSVSIQLSKTFDLTDKTTLDLGLGWAYLDAEVGNPVNSSTASSSFEEVATAVINDVKLGPALWANKQNFVLRARLEHYFLDSHPTSIGMFYRKRSGRPFSYVYDNNTPTTVFGDSDNEERNLLYVPTGPNDPLVSFAGLDSDGTTQDFFDFLERSGLNAYAGGFAPKNGFRQPWASDLDIRIQQNLPTPWGTDHELQLFLDIENVLNLFSDGNNVARYVDTGDVQEGVPVLDALLTNGGTQYLYDNFNPGGGNSAPSYNAVNQIDVDDSVYRIQFGIRYRF